MVFKIIIGCVLLVTLGFIFGREFPKKPKTVGTLRIDTSDIVDGPFMFLELKTGVDDIMHSKLVQLDVNTESYLPQK